MALVSVIVPVYKVEEYIEKCIESILSQSFRDYEIILVDDGSTDNCGKMCDELSLCAEIKDSPIYVIHQTNKGLSGARNSGIDWAMLCSDSEWVCFVDSDDTITDKYIEKLYEAAAENNADLAICDFRVVDSDGNSIYKTNAFSSKALSDNNSIFEIMHREWSVHPAWNKLYKNELFQDLRFDVGKLHEDEFIIHKVLFLCDRVVFLKDRLYSYLIRSSGIIGTGNRQTKVHAFQADIERYWFCKKNSLPFDLKVLGIDYMSLVRDFDDKDITKEYKKVFFDYKPNQTIRKQIFFRFFPLYNWYRKRRLS